MFHDMIASSSTGETVLEWIEIAALAIEILAVLIIVVAIGHAVARYSYKVIFRPEEKGLYQELKIHLGKALLLGLEILVAADIIRTVALEATLESVVILGLLVLIRTFLSWALVVEIEGHWPWKSATKDGNVEREEL